MFKVLPAALMVFLKTKGFEMSEWDASLQLCVFDTSRGQCDGHELDKILFFYPTDCPLAAQLSLIGLGEGLITFTKIFSPDAPCDVIDSERRLHVLFQPEQGLWMIMVLDKRKENSEIGRTHALQAVLREAHGLFTLFYGSLKALLSNNPSGDIARSCLHAFLPDYLADLLTGKKLLMMSSHFALQERGSVQMTALDRGTALEVQSLIDLLQSWFGSGRICHTLLLFQDLLVSSTLSPEDAAYLFTYARMRLTPAAISATSSGHSLKKSPLREDSGDQGLEVFTPRPLQRDKWWRDHDGFLITDAWGVEAQGMSAIIPTVWLHQSSEECMQLVAYQHKQLTVIMLISVVHLAADIDGSHVLRNQVVDKASNRLSVLEERISRDWGGINANHVPGYRYLWVDHDSRVSKASPGSKITTLTKDSLLSLDKVRAEIDAAKARSDRKDPAQFRELETCVRTRSNAWVVVRIRGSHELYIVLERASETLLLTAEATEKFSRRHCDGIFDSD
ncbi:hypothetical protein GOP47_0020482 [Adiantum capillus-veneris]|uniref:CCZ1/INTU/HSP4 first Longin domain-containing protein n=1 Tax=Adiantum capillus-veneris TaxID=13818 RepID=A0A9D4U9L1_ADICA|nr:hypothetical protein GOP47_0020482 [Adiantum capillus-veneris]